MLFLLPNSAAKLQPLDQGVIANFKVHYHRRVVERLLVDNRNKAGSMNRKVTLAKALFFASGAWRDVKPGALELEAFHDQALWKSWMMAERTKFVRRQQ